MPPQAYAAKAADHLLLSEFEHMEESAATADTPSASELCGNNTNISVSPLVSPEHPNNSESFI